MPPSIYDTYSVLSILLELLIHVLVDQILPPNFIIIDSDADSHLSVKHFGHKAFFYCIYDSGKILCLTFFYNCWFSQSTCSFISPNICMVWNKEKSWWTCDFCKDLNHCCLWEPTWILLACSLSHSKYLLGGMYQRSNIMKEWHKIPDWKTWYNKRVTIRDVYK